MGVDIYGPGIQSRSLKRTSRGNALALRFPVGFDRCEDIPLTEEVERGKRCAQCVRFRQGILTHCARRFI